MFCEPFLNIPDRQNTKVEHLPANEVSRKRVSLCVSVVAMTQPGLESIWCCESSLHHLLSSLRKKPTPSHLHPTNKQRLLPCPISSTLRHRFTESAAILLTAFWLNTSVQLVLWRCISGNLACTSSKCLSFKKAQWRTASNDRRQNQLLMEKDIERNKVP